MIWREDSASRKKKKRKKTSLSPLTSNLLFSLLFPLLAFNFPFSLSERRPRALSS